MPDVTLSNAVRSNLLNLQSTASLMADTQERLSTGLKVNSALDNPTNFFTAASLNSRASDLGSLLDSVSNGVQTLEAADNGIEAITKLVESAQSTARQALQDRSSASDTETTAATSVDSATTKTAALAKTLDTDLGLTVGDTIEFVATNDDTGLSESFTHTVVAGDTVSDLVTGINQSGAADASVNADGEINFATEGANGLVITVDAAEVDGDADALNHADDFLTALGVASTSTTNYTTDGVGTDQAVVTVAAAVSASSDVRAGLAEQFDSLLGQIDELAEDSGFNGVNLLGGTSEELQVTFNEDASSSITIDGVDFSAAGIGLTSTSGDFAGDTEINAKLDDLKGALADLKSQASKFGSNLSVVETRQNFTDSMINTLETGAANLTLADTNEEAANLLALQTRQQLSSTALSLASQSDQQVLQLF